MIEVKLTNAATRALKAAKRAGMIPGLVIGFKTGLANVRAPILSGSNRAAVEWKEKKIKRVPLWLSLNVEFWSILTSTDSNGTIQYTEANQWGNWQC